MIGLDRMRSLRSYLTVGPRDHGCGLRQVVAAGHEAHPAPSISAAQTSTRFSACLGQPIRRVLPALSSSAA